MLLSVLLALDKHFVDIYLYILIKHDPFDVIYRLILNLLILREHAMLLIQGYHKIQVFYKLFNLHCFHFRIDSLIGHMIYTIDRFTLKTSIYSNL